MGNLDEESANASDKNKDSIAGVVSSDDNNIPSTDIPVINNVLCYLSSARDSMKYDDIVRTCLVFYNENDIIASKDLLFKYVGERPIRRRNENKILHEIKDIMEMLKKCDENGAILPHFVASRFDSLPPSSGFEIVAQQMIVLTNQVTELKNEVKYLRETRQEETLSMQNNAVILEDIMNIKHQLVKLNHNVLGSELKRNSIILQRMDKRVINDDESSTSCIDEMNDICGTPVTPGFSKELNDFNPNYMSNELVDNPLTHSPSAPSASQMQWNDYVVRDGGGHPTAPSFADITNTRASSEFLAVSAKKSSLSHPKTVPNKPRVISNVLVSSPVANGSSSKPSSNKNGNRDEVDDEGFILVKNKRKRHNGNIIGSRQTEHGSLKSAVRTADIYVGNCGPDVNAQSIEEYLLDIYKIKINKCEELITKSQTYKAFKVSLNLDDRTKVLSPDAWPRGITCRKFYNPRIKNNG